MPKHRSPAQPDEDEAESRRFIEAAEKLAAEGDLDSNAEDALERLMEKAAPPKRPS